MTDIKSNIDLNIDASGALNTLRELQRQVSVFQSTMSKTGAVSNTQLRSMQQNLINGINSTGQFSASMQNIRSTTESFTNALEKNKLSLGQYFKYAGASTQSFGRLFRNEFDTIDKVARERVKSLQTQYIKMGRDANGALQAISVRPLTLDLKDHGTQLAIAAQKQQLFNQLMQQGSTNLLNFGKNTQWAGRQLMVGFTIPLGIMGAAAAKEFSAIEEQVVRLERVYGDFTTTVAQSKEMTSQIKELAGEFTKYGVSVSKTMSLAADAAAMGKQGKDLIAQVKETNKLAVLGSVTQQQALETTISLTSAFGYQTDELSKKINFLNAVENQTVTSIDDLTTAIPTAGPVVKQLGGQVEDLAFFLTAMKEGGIDASEGANALKSGLASLINPTGEAVQMLSGFNINLENIVQTNKGNVKGIVVDFAKALDTLDPLNRAQAIEQLFGKFQFSRMSTLFQNVIAEGSQAQTVLELTNSSASQLAALSQKELSRIEESPLYKFQGAIEDFKAAIAPIGETFMNAVTPIIDFGTKLLDGFNSWSEEGKSFTVILVGAVAGIGPVLLMTFGLIANGVANLIKGFLAVKNIFSSTGKSSNILAEQTNYMTSEQIKAASVAASLGQTHNSLIQTFNVEAGVVRNLAAAYGQAIAAQGMFTGPVFGTAKGGAKKMASGGIVSGPGTGTSDSVPAMLSNGEAVIPAANVKKNPGLVSALVSGSIPRFANGTTGAATGKTAVVAFGAHQPFTIAHESIAQLGKQMADSIGAEFKQFTSAGSKEKRSVLTPDERAKMIEESIGQAPDIAKNPFDVFEQLANQGVSSAKMLLGEDRMASSVWDKAAEKFGIQLEKIQIDRAEDSPSGTKTRDFAAAGDYESFSKMIATGVSEETKRAVFDSMRNELGKRGSTILPEIQSQAKQVEYQLPRTQKSHTQLALDNNNRDAFAASDTSLKFFDKLQQVPEEIRKRISVTGSLVANLTEQMNQDLRESGSGIDPNDFESVWNARSNKYKSSARAAGLNVDDPEIAKELAQIENEVGARAAKLAREAGVTVKDSIVAEAAEQVINEARSSKNGNRAAVAEGLNQRKNTAGDYRTNFTDKEIRSMLADGQAYQKGTMVYTSQGDVAIAGQRPNGKYKQTAKSISGGYASWKDESFVSQPAVEQAWLDKQKAKRGNRGTARQSAKKIVQDEINEFSEGLKEAAKTASPSKRTRKVAQDTVDGYVLGLEDGKDKIEQQAKSQAQRLADVQKNTNPAFGKVSSKPQIVSPAMQQYLQEQARKQFPGGVGQDAIREMGRAKLTPNFNLYEANMGKMSRQLQLAQLPLKMITDGLTSMKTATVSAGNSIKQISKEIGTSLVASAKRFGVVAKEAASNLAIGAKSMISSGISKAKTGLGNIGGFFSSGKGAGVGMAASMGLMMASGMEGPVGDIAGQLSGPLMILSTLGPVLSKLPPQVMIAAAALAVLGGAIYLVNDHVNKMNEAARKNAEALSTGTNAINKFAEATGETSIVEQQRQKDMGKRTGAKKTADGEQAFGSQYLASDLGKQFVSEVQSTKSSKGIGVAAEGVANQMAASIVAGVLTADQANSIIDSLAVQLNDSSLAVNIKGNLTELVGVNGQNVTDKPVDVAVNLIDKSGKTLSDTIKNMDFKSISGGIFDEKGNQKRAENEATIAQSMSDIVDNGELALASSRAKHESTMAELQANKDIAAINAENVRYNQEQLAIRTKVAGVESQIVDKLNESSTRRYSRAGSAYTETQYASGVVEQLQQQRNKEWETQLSQDAQAKAKATTEAFADTNQLKAGTKATLLATINISNIETFNQLKDMFPPNEAGSEKVYDYVAGVSADYRDDVANIINMFGDDKERAKNFIANVDVKGAEKLADVQKILEETGQSFNIDVFIDKDGNLTQQGKDLTDTLTAVDSYFADGQQKTYEVGMKFGSTGFELTQSQAEYYNSLPPEQQKLFTTTFLTVLKTINANTAAGQSELLNWAKTQEGGTAKYATVKAQNAGSRVADRLETNFDYTAMNTDYAAWQATKAVSAAQAAAAAATQSMMDNAASGGGGGGGGGGGSTEAEKDPTSFLDSIVKDLRQFTNATQGLTENFADSMNAIRNATTSAFSGLSQQIRSLGVGEDVVQLMTGMSKEEWDQYKGQFFNFDGAGNITSLKSDLVFITDKIRAISLGKFVDEQQKSVANMKDQAAGLAKLVSLGMSYANAYKVIEDAALAAAIANAKSADEIRSIIALANQAKKTQDLASASSNIADTNAQTDATLAGLAAVQKYNAALTDTQVAAILASDDLQIMLANIDNLSIDQLKVLNETLKDIESKQQLEIDIKMQTAEGMQELFTDGLNKAMEQFSAREQSIKIDFELKKSPFQDIIDNATNAINDIKNAPGGLDDLEADLTRISDQEDAVNKKYDARYEALDRIQKINDRIAQQQQRQLTLADAISMGDIAAAARAAQEMRANDAAQALTDQREALQKAQQLELDNLTATTGLTRKQIEEQIKTIKAQILEIEEQQIEPAERQIELLDRQQESAINALTVAGQTKDQWEATKNQIDLARVSTEEYEDAIARAKGLVQTLVDKWGEVPTDITTIHTIIEKTISDKKAAAAAAAAAAPVAAPAPAAPAPVQTGYSDEWLNEMARRVYRGEFGNGKARKNALGDAYEAIQARVNRNYYAKGGLVASYLADGGFPMMPKIGTDTVPAMLTPGEFVIKKYAVENFGVDNLKAINDGTYSGGSVYNNTYSINVNAKTNANADEIAQVVIKQIRNIDAQRIRSNRL